MAIVAVSTPITALTYPIAIVLPKKHEDAMGLVKLSTGLAIAISSLTMVILLMWGVTFANFLNAVEIAPYLWLIPLSMLFAALCQIATQWLIRHKQFRIMARAAIVQSALVNLTKAGAGFVYPLGGVLIAIQACSQGLLAFLLWLGVRQSKLQKTTSNDKSRTPIRELAYRHRDFALFRAPEWVIGAASQSLPVLMLTAFFGPVSAGFYTLGRAVMEIPAGLIGKSVGDVFYPRISEAANSGDKIYPLVRKATFLLAAAGFLPFAIVIAIGPWLFTFVFGAEWIAAGEYARWLAVWMFFGFTNNPSVKVIPIVNAQAFQLLYTIITIILRLGALTFAYLTFNTDISVIIVFSIIGGLFNIFLMLVVFNKCKKFDRAKV